MQAVHFGAGNIGRGFIGSLLHKAGYHVCFVDVNDEIVSAINERKSYEIVLAGESEQTETIKDISALNSQTQRDETIDAIANADLVTTAVGPNILELISDLIAEGLRKRSKNQAAPLNVIACENAIHASSNLEGFVNQHLTADEREMLNQSVSFPNAAVDRIVPNQQHEDKLKVSVEPFYEWVVDQTQIIGEKPSVAGITYVDELTPYIERKLFTVNTGHAMTAYLGYQLGKNEIKEAIEDPFIHDNVQSALDETGSLLIRKYQFDQAEHAAYIRKIMERFKNPNISDPVTRVARSPIRKLGPDDRLVRPARELAEFGLEAEHLTLGIAAALMYDYQEDQEAVTLQQTLQTEGLAEAILSYTGLGKDNPLTDAIQNQFQFLKSKKKNNETI